MGVAERHVTVDGLNTRFLEAGDGQPLILMHGASLGSSSDVWALQMEPFAQAGFRSIAYDDPGFGLSDDPLDLTVMHRVTFFPKLLAAMGIPRANVIGHSQSGAIAVQAALKQPELFTRLMIIGTGSLVPPLPGAGRDEFSEEPDHEPTLEHVKDQLKVHVYDVNRIPAHLIERRLVMSTGQSFRAYQKRRNAPRMTTGDINPPLWQGMTDLKMPLLMMFGRGDTRNGVFHRAELAKERFPSLHFEFVDEASHLIQWDQPERFLELTLKFLKS